ncbi:MAG: hypothetical protein JRG97_05575 [Deltaproteobacteria bacterium]|nr:hypothetical protein [Deltaproteobacteria bacterium]MBW2051001.1 hypothetical protein [Deltaproteobacteria bacterium]MBW2140528.1 hypothetical protein [Deltaproteobacteria bacterium]MBW2323652.1 hypothetical protein [Deltaproteobacteria bacterium]
MSSKVLIIVSSGEREKALTGLMYARNALLWGWLDDIKVMFFGPSEGLLLEDEQVRQEAQEIAETEKPLVCKFISDQEGTSEKIEELGLKVAYVGPIISDLIKDGYVPMVF